MNSLLAVLLGFWGWWQKAPPAPPVEPGNEVVREAPAATSGLIFAGAESFSEAHLLRALRKLDVRSEAPLELTEVDDAAFFVQQFYLEQGFAGAEVSYRYDALARKGGILINEGPVTYLGRFTFQGGEALSATRQHDIVLQSLRLSARSFTARLRFVEEALWRAADDLAAVYRRMGYLRVEVTFQPVDGGAPGTRDVEFFVIQGPQFLVREVVLAGEKPEGLSDLGHELQGTPWNDEEEVLLVGKFYRELQNLGFHRAEVAVVPELNEENGDVTVRVELRPGPLYRFGGLDIRGNQRTFSGAIANRLGLRPGQVYDRSALLAGERRLWFSGAFSEVRTELVEREGEVLDVNVEVEEGKARKIRGTVGYSQWEQFFVNLSYSDRNLLGTLRELKIEGAYSALGYGGSLQLIEPMLFNSEVRADSIAFFLRSEMPGYRASFLGAGVGIGRQFDPPNQTAFQLQYLWRSVFDIEIFGAAGMQSADELSYSVGMLAWRQTLDRRNNPLAPMQGFLLDYQLGLATEALGGTINFFQPEAQATFYQPLREITPERPFVPFLVFNHRIGLIAPFGGTGEIPTPERFFMGGPNSVRSFQFDGMGPRDADGDPIGGEFFWLLTGELQVPILGPFYGVTFLDAGNLALTLAEYDWDYTRVALGVGARLYTPIGAVRVDYGYNLIRGPGDPIGAVLFGFGFTF